MTGVIEMSWSVTEYEKGYEAFLAGSARHSWESAQWQHGWNDAAAHAKAGKAIAKAGGAK